MKILVIGCGSIGKRHIRNLISIKEKNILAYDTDEKKLKDVKKIHSSIMVGRNLTLLWQQNPDVVFVTAPTALHIEYALMAAEKKCHLFIEKPLSDNLRKVPGLAELISKNQLIAMVGCNMRFYWSISTIKELLKKNILGKITSARIEFGQYLPDWHPQEDYRKMYSAQKKLGGGVILDAIHELDYAKWFFGEVTGSSCMSAKLSDLEIDTEDTAEILLGFKNGPIVNIHLDYIQRIYSRNCKIIGEKGTIFWNFNKHCIMLYRVNAEKWEKIPEPKGYNLNQMYIDEIKYFLNRVKNNQETFNSIPDALDTLKVALRIKQSKDVRICLKR